jgi:hypothetical protein
MNYKIIKQNDLISSIFETRTEQYVAMRLPANVAKDLCRSLNFGSGFDGFTPSFFNERIVGTL